MMMYKKGISVGQLIEVLKQLPKKKPFFVCSDEEQNQTFKGVYIEHNEDSVIIAGLTGLEVENGI